jgi:CDGSH-type Zn-finger protein
MAEIEIEVKESGPYRIRGPLELLRIVDAEGNEYDLEKKVVRDHGPVPFIALCRCGGSSRKPFCDGTHKRNGFTALERADG